MTAKSICVSFLFASTALLGAMPAAAQDAAPPAPPAEATETVAADPATVTPPAAAPLAIMSNDDIVAACRTVESQRHSFLLFSFNRRNETSSESCRNDMRVLTAMLSSDPQIRTFGIGEYLRRDPAGRETINQLAREEFAIQNLPALVFTFQSQRAGASAQTMTCGQQVAQSTTGDVVFSCQPVAPQAPPASEAPTDTASDATPQQLSMTAPQTALGYRFGRG